MYEGEEKSFPHRFSYDINWFGIWCLMPLSEFELSNLVLINTDCTCSCKSNYHTIMTTTAPPLPSHVHYKYYYFDQHYPVQWIGSIKKTQTDIIYQKFLSYKTIHVNVNFFSPRYWGGGGGVWGGFPPMALSMPSSVQYKYFIILTNIILFNEYKV